MTQLLHNFSVLIYKFVFATMDILVQSVIDLYYSYTKITIKYYSKMCLYNKTSTSCLSIQHICFYRLGDGCLSSKINSILFAINLREYATNGGTFLK